jgi:hypothetical protein
MLPAALLAAGVLAGCSSGGSSTATSTSSAAVPAASSSGTAGAGGGQFGAAFQAYSACLTKNGVTLPSRAPGVRPSNFPSGRVRPSNLPSGVRPSGGFRGGFGGGFAGGFSSTAPSGVDQGTYTKALAACASLRPSFTPGAGGGGGANVDATALAAYLSCLSDHGVKVTGTGVAALRSLNRSDTKVAAALKICAPLLPTRSAAPSPPPSAS